MQTLKNFRASERVRRRAWDLLRREQYGALTPEESAELDYYLELDQRMRAARARARQRPRG